MKTIVFLLLTFSFFTFSCGFNIQKKADLPFKEIHLRNIENLTLEPGLQDKMRKTAYQTLTENGFKVAKTSAPILDIQIKRYRLITLSEIGLITVEYEIKMDVKAILYDEKGNKLKEILPTSSLRTVFRTSRELQKVIAHKELAIESLLKDIAQDITRQLIFHVSPSKI